MKTALGNTLAEHLLFFIKNLLNMELDKWHIPNELWNDLSIKVTHETFGTLIIMGINWNGRELGASKTIGLIPFHGELASNAAAGAFSQMSAQRAVDEFGEYWQFVHNQASEFVRMTANHILANWECLILMTAPSVVSRDYHAFEVSTASFLFNPDSVPHLVFFWKFPNLSKAQAAMPLLTDACQKYKDGMEKSYSDALLGGTLSPYAYKPYTLNMLVEHLSSVVKGMATHEQ